MNYKGYSKKRPVFSLRHLKYNNTHIDRNILEKFQPYNLSFFQRPQTLGPVFISKLWVLVKGNCMLLPVWCVYREKYEAKLNNNSHSMVPWSKASIEHMKLFTRVTVIGEGDSHEVKDPNSQWIDHYDYIAKIADIEEYTKQRFKESLFIQKC